MCEKYQISHSHYLGGPARWTALDRAKAEEFAEYQAGFCPDCGTRPEWWKPREGGHRFAFVAETHRCPGCEIKEQEREQIPDSAKGIHVSLVPNPDLLPDDMKESEHGRRS